MRKLPTLSLTLLLVGVLIRSTAPQGVALKPVQPRPSAQRHVKGLSSPYTRLGLPWNFVASGEYWGRSTEQTLPVWATRDPVGALSWLVSDSEDAKGFGNTYPFERREMVLQIFATLPVSLVADCLNILRDDPALSSAISSAVVTGKLDAKDVLENLSSYATDAMASQVAEAVVEVWGNIDPEAAKEWVVLQPDSDARAAGILHLGRSLLVTDPETSMQWVEENLGDSLKPGTIEFLVSCWFDTDPVASGHWVQQRVGDPVMDDAIGTLAQKIRDNNPEAAIQWALMIVDENRRRSVLEHVQLIEKVP